MKTTRIIAAAALVVAGALVPQLALAQWAGIKRTDLGRNDLSFPGREVIQVLVEFAPGVAAPNHAHPGEEIAYVIEGSFEYAGPIERPGALRTYGPDPKQRAEIVDYLKTLK